MRPFFFHVSIGEVKFVWVGHFLKSCKKVIISVTKVSTQFLLVQNPQWTTTGMTTSLDVVRYDTKIMVCRYHNKTNWKRFKGTFDVSCITMCRIYEYLQTSDVVNRTLDPPRLMCLEGSQKISSGFWGPLRNSNHRR